MICDGRVPVWGASAATAVARPRRAEPSAVEAERISPLVEHRKSDGLRRRAQDNY